MDETIGVKGGKNDRKRFLFITRKQQEKENSEKEELKKREKKVKRNQVFILIKTIPIVLVGGTFKTLYNNAQKKRFDEDNEKIKWRVKEDKNDFIKKPESRQQGGQIVVKIQENIPMPKTNEKSLEESNDTSFSDLLPISQRKKLEKLKAHKIIDVYESELKDLRYELRELMVDFNVLKDEEEKIVYSEDAISILDKLSQIIDKIELLKRKLEIDNFEQYDDNYIYTLIEDYLSEFRNGIYTDEVVDSPLYILISEKLNELEQEREKLQIRVEKKKELLKDREVQFEELKKNYYSIEKANQALWEFQNEQDLLLREVEEKIRNAVSVEEKVKVEIEAMNKHSKRLLELLSFQMLFPGFRGAKKVATSAALYLYFVNQLIKPKTTTKKYRVVSVLDYRDDIEKSMDALDDASFLLSKTSNKIDEIISQVQDMFKDYIDYNYEYDQLLSNLYKVKSDLKEKEYEMEKLRKRQELLLENNEAKVKRRGEYQM